MLSKARGVWIGGRIPGPGNILTGNLWGLEAAGDSSGSIVEGNSFHDNTSGDMMTRKAKRLVVVQPPVDA